MQRVPQLIQSADGTRCLAAEDRMNSDMTSTNIEGETERTHQGRAVQTLLHLPCQQQQ